MSEQIKGLPQLDQSIINRAREIIISGFNANQTADIIRGAIFSEGDVPFSKLNRLFTAIATHEGYLTSTKDVFKSVAESVTLSFEETYVDLRGMSESLSEMLKLSPDNILAAFKSMFKAAGKRFPKESASTRKRLGSINKAIIDVFAKNQEASINDLTEALTGVCKSPEVALKRAKQYYPLVVGIMYRLTSSQVMEWIAKNEVKKPPAFDAHSDAVVTSEKTGTDITESLDTDPPAWLKEDPGPYADADKQLT